jgi:hypothetical protein
MKKTLFTILTALTFAGVVSAQTPTGTPSSQLSWDQVAPTVNDARAYVYKYYPDGATAASAGVTIPTVTCTGLTSPFQCSASFPAFTPGPHTLTLTASSAAGESAKSPSMSFTFVVIPAAPANLRIE